MGWGMINWLRDYYILKVNVSERNVPNDTPEMCQREPSLVTHRVECPNANQYINQILSVRIESILKDGILLGKVQKNT